MLSAADESMLLMTMAVQATLDGEACLARYPRVTPSAVLSKLVSRVS